MQTDALEQESTIAFAPTTVAKAFLSTMNSFFFAWADLFSSFVSFWIDIQRPS